jgi:dihydropteroate synthase
MSNIRKMDCLGLPLVIGERTLIMGILNVTPDSFSDGGRYNTIEAAVEQARRLVDEGADILDIGGESTRPGAQKVSAEEELRRIIPIIEAISQELTIPISVDTYKAEVAKQALSAGAHMINDIWGCKERPGMAELAAEFECPIVLMHNRKVTQYQHLMMDIIEDLEESVRLAHQAGIRDEQIILDPGIGFAKTIEHNLEVMANLSEITKLGYPVLLGTSRKSFIQRILGLPANDVLEGTAATVVIGISQGCEIMRVHDVKALKRVATMSDAIVRR